VIEAIRTEHGLVIDAELAVGSAAFFDREWAPLDRSTVVPAVVVTGSDTERLSEAARALGGIADDAVAASPDGEAAVTGSGFIAKEARRRLAAEGRLANAGAASPDAVIETTGDPQTIVEATMQVRTLGTVVLVGEPLGRNYDFDLYPDVHVRGLRLIARGRVGATLRAEAQTATSHGNQLQTVTPGQPLDASAIWFCVVRADDA
jgi:threonine dehydrogenase-like Zn-dependent dehydrogenase